MSREIWRIDKLVPGGAGMARRADGSVGFASGALPGERIEVSRLIRKKGFAEAREFDLLEPSSERVEPACPVARACGGCDWLHLEYEAQLRHKASLLAEALQRTGGFRSLSPISVTPSPRRSAYRSRIRLHIDEQGRFGFFAPSSQRLVEVASCAAALPELDAALQIFGRCARLFPKLLAVFEQAELRVARSPTSFGLRLTPRAASGPGQGPKAHKRQAAAASTQAARLLTELRSHMSVAVAGHADEFRQQFALSDSLCLSVPSDAFVQVNWEVNLLLIASLVDGARALGARRFLDLYAGAGNFTLALAAAGLRGISIEGHPSAALAAERSAESQGFAKRVTVKADDVRAALASLERGTSGFDLAVLDPPRAGARDILASLVALAPRAIAYCSCDPVTLARDLRTLSEHGYALDRVQAFDMFPGTHHLEALAWLSQRSTQGVSAKQ